MDAPRYCLFWCFRRFDITIDEKFALREAIAECWSDKPTSTEALETTVVISVKVDKHGVPVIGSLRLVESSTGTSSAAQDMFENARRAIISPHRT